MLLQADHSRRGLTKRARKGSRGYPLASIIFNGPDEKIATKAGVGFLAFRGAETHPIRRWVRDTELRTNTVLWDEMAEFIALGERACAAQDARQGLDGQGETQQHYGKREQGDQHQRGTDVRPADPG